MSDALSHVTQDMQIVGKYFHTLMKRCCCCLHLQFLVSSSKWSKIPIAHLRCSMCLFMQLFWHSVSPNVTLKDNKCFCIMVDGVPSCSIGSPPSVNIKVLHYKVIILRVVLLLSIKLLKRVHVIVVVDSI